MTINLETGYYLDRNELLRLHDLRMLTNDRDYLYFALQIDYPDKLNPTVGVGSFCEHWDLSVGNFYKALGELQNKGIVVELTSQLDLRMHSD